MKCWREHSSKEGLIQKKELASANDDLSDYFSQQDQIDELKKEVEKLKALLKSEIKLKSKWKCRYEKTHYAVSKLGRLIITLFFPFILICSGVGDL